MEIVLATLRCGLNGQIWFMLKLLSQVAVFDRMLAVLACAAGMRDAIAVSGAEPGAIGEGEKHGVGRLARQIAHEMEEAWRVLLRV